jgi:hypothetical protein
MERIARVESASMLKRLIVLYSAIKKGEIPNPFRLKHMIQTQRSTSSSYMLLHWLIKNRIAKKIEGIEAYEVDMNKLTNIIKRELEELIEDKELLITK